MNQPGKKLDQAGIAELLVFGRDFCVLGWWGGFMGVFQVISLYLKKRKVLASSLSKYQALFFQANFRKLILMPSIVLKIAE